MQVKKIIYNYILCIVSCKIRKYVKYVQTMHSKNAVDIGIKFIDVFESMEWNENKILTFSNMPWPGMVSRPDRLYLADTNNNALQIRSVDVIGDGEYYKQNYFYYVLWDRFWQTLNGMKCKIYCGPNGYCKCGVCVKNPHAIVDEMSDCQSTCDDCLNDIISLVKWVLIIGNIHFGTYYGCIHRFIAPRYKFNSTQSIPIIVVFLLSFMISTMILIWYFTKTIQYTVTNMLPEELFPSDHRGLLATFEYS